MDTEESDLTSISELEETEKEAMMQDPEEPGESEEKQAQESEQEAEEEVYEVETILDAVVREQGTQYLVKWKGYDEKHNSWVHEKDAEGAKEIIEAFWKMHKKARDGPRRPTKKKRRAKLELGKSAAKDREDEGCSKTPGRSSESQATSQSKESENWQFGDVQREHQPISEDEGASAKGRMMPLGSWEDIVDKIQAVERTNGGELLVYFTMKYNNTIRQESSTVCGARMPHKLINFYESIIQW